jgi:hypothetical protein
VLLLGLVYCSRSAWLLMAVDLPLGSSTSVTVASRVAGCGRSHETAAEKIAEKAALLLVSVVSYILPRAVGAVLGGSSVHGGCRWTLNLEMLGGYRDNVCLALRYPGLFLFSSFALVD